MPIARLEKLNAIVATSVTRRIGTRRSTQYSFGAFSKKRAFFRVVKSYIKLYKNKEFCLRSVCFSVCFEQWPKWARENQQGSTSCSSAQ